MNNNNQNNRYNNSCNCDQQDLQLKDYGPQPFVINIEEATKQNNTFRTALWTGKHLQLTLMSIPVGGEIGLEIHPNIDQFIRIEQGQGLVKMGTKKDFLDFQETVSDNDAIFIPSGHWHNIINTGDESIKLYSIYAPPQHPHGTVQVTKADAEAAEKVHVTNYENESSIYTTINYIGAKASKSDEYLTPEDMLTYALQDEYLARTRYSLAIQKFGAQRLFNNILGSEKLYINHLIHLLKKYNVTLPVDNSIDYVTVPADIKESLETAIEGETESIAMYERFLQYQLPEDVKTIFTLLKNGSQNHLNALRRVYEFNF